MIVYDKVGLAHEVYNKTEIKQLYERYRALANWQIRTLCCTNDPSPFLGLGTDAPDMGDCSRGDVVTCIRCASEQCDHGITFDSRRAVGFSAAEVRENWPRLFGECPRGCGYIGIAYASREHYYA